MRADGEVVTAIVTRSVAAHAFGCDVSIGRGRCAIRVVRGDAIRPHAGRHTAATTPDRARIGALIESQVANTFASGSLGWSFFGTDGCPYLMSNWHVLAAQQLACVDEGRITLGRNHQPIARLHAYAHVDVAGPNAWDLAIARYDDPALVGGGFATERGARGLGAAPRSLAPPVFGDVYYKVGAATAYREARYAGVGTHAVALGKDPAGITFTRLCFFESISGQRFSSGGDSGSVIIHARTGAATALLIGGFDTEHGSVSVGCPIHEAFEVVGCARTSEGEALACLDYPAARKTRNLEWVRVDARSPTGKGVGT